MEALLAAVDVGTASARAGIFDRSGRLLGRAVAPIAMRRPDADRAEQDSEGIWRAVCSALAFARREAGAGAAAVAAIGFDATCSLVLRDRQGRPLAPEADDADHWDTMVWLDHRARAEAAECRDAAAGLPFDLGASPEMQVPKLLWLKRRQPALWHRLGAAFDLADFLTWRASGSPARSVCTLGCKWGYQPRADPPWPAALFARLGLDDLLERCALPARAAPVGDAVGRLSDAAAAELGLEPGCTVAVGLVDAHAGALGLLGRFADDAPALASRRALIAGTSTCIMGFLPAPLRAPGLWGPCPDVVLPGYWMLEGGQSASGALLEHLCRSWGGRTTEPGHVLRRIAELIAIEGADLAPRLHVLPDFHGNRTPHADPDALGVVSGLRLDASFDGLSRLFWRACTGLALGLRQILELQAAHGWPAERLHIAGGHAESPLLVQLYADATGRPVEVSTAPDPILLGTAMAAAASARLVPDLGAAARAMHQPSRTVAPDPASALRMERDYTAFLALERHRAELDALAGRSADPAEMERAARPAVMGSPPRSPSGAPTPMHIVR